MRVRFVAQPYSDQRSLLEFLTDASDDAEAIVCVVAWVRRSGLSVIEDSLRAFTGRGGRSALFVGIDQGLATRQGLELALQIFDAVYVVHDESAGGRRTFHPKVYVASKPDVARVFVGSNNLTPGGLQANYEAALEVDLDVTMPEDTLLLGELQAYVARLQQDTAICKPLDSPLLAELAAHPRYRILDEDVAAPVEPDEATSATVGGGATPPLVGAPLFGSSDQEQRGFPRRLRTTPGAVVPTVPPSPSTPSGGAGPAAMPPSGGATGATTVAVARRWFKRMPASDAQHPPLATSNITGALRLTQAGHPIDQRTYFRNEFFGGLGWGPDPDRAGGEIVWVDFDVVVAGRRRGVVALAVVHDPSRVSGQGNFATTIKWGALLDEIRSGNYVDDFVTLERITPSDFRLVVSGAPAGPFAR
jgi:HKD family nuclease